jgi:hypothetical protein
MCGYFVIVSLICEILSFLAFVNPENWEWKQLKPRESELDKLKERREKYKEIEGRYGCAMGHYQNKLYIYGGGGDYVQPLKVRNTFSDTWIFDLSKALKV